MGMRRFTRLTNAFNKSAEAHYNMIALYVIFHNFCRDHKTLRMTVSDIGDLIEAREEPPKKRGS